MKRKRSIFILLILLFLFVFIGCKKIGNDESRKDTSVNNVHEDFDASNENSPKNIFPLTGIETMEEIDHRIISVMINNHPKARPQSGLSKADIVFEILAEGTTTRFLALFHSEMPDIVGPVRSAREYYFELAKDYDSIYVYHGAADFVNDMILNRGVDHLNGTYHDHDQQLFKRESFRKAPHNSYLLMNNVYEFAEAKGYDVTNQLEPLLFLTEEDSVSKDDDGTYIKIGYIGPTPRYIVEYIYDEVEEAYIRSSDGVQSKELNDDSLIKVHNVFLLETTHEVIDSEGRRSIDLQSGGQALLLQQGKMQRVNWENQNGMIVPVKNGEVLGLLPGKTWIHVVPDLEQSIEMDTQ